MTDPRLDLLDRPHEECGVFGVVTRRGQTLDVSRITYFGLHALQHRGQESAGIAVASGRTADVHKGMGLVARVFSDPVLDRLKGSIALGHNRYSTTGGSHLRNAQPCLVDTLYGPLAVAHNGNITNAEALRRGLQQRGVGFNSSTDTEVATQFLVAPQAEEPNDGTTTPSWVARLQALMHAATGAYSLGVLVDGGLYGLRDPHGLRPLSVGTIVEDGEVLGWAIASESTALHTVGARDIREIDPGEIIRIDPDGVESVAHHSPLPKPALCVFEYIYFARPDTVLEGRSVNIVRRRLGVRLGQESPAIADVVIDVPDSGKPAAMGYAAATGIPYAEGLIKNRYVGRTFIQPTARLRRHGVRLKYSTLRETIEGRRVVLVDDSIVRGTTIGPLIRLLREGGAREVHVRVAAPAIRHPCYMGVDMSDYDQLIAHRMPIADIGAHVGADSLAYLSVPGMTAAVQSGLPSSCGHCDACFTGQYPVPVPAHASEGPSAKLRFERTPLS